MSALRYGSLFSGIGGFDLGFDRAGLECAWQVEIDRDCVDVLARHWPEVERHGDVREVGAANLAPVDVIVGGFPCQDVSVAGRRAGLAGARSGLWWEFHRILGELRPAWVVIENVPGLLSSCGGRDMGTVLGSLGDLGYGWSYRVLDAQWFGVAQRRRRVFIVGHLGDKRAAQVLLEPEGGGRDTPPSRTTRTRVAASLTAGSHGPGVNRPGRRREGDENLVAAALNSGGNNGGFRTEPGQHLVVAPTLAPGAHPGGVTGREAENGGALVVAQALTGTFANGGADDNRAQGGFLVPVARALTAPSSPRYDGDTETFVAAPTLRGNWRNNSNPVTEASMLVAHALTAEGHDASEDGTGRGVPLVAHSPTSSYAKTSDHAGTNGSGPTNVLTLHSGIRRLTPTEAERLQGFPDGWTALGAMETARIERDIAALMATRPGFAEALAEAAASSHGQADLADMVRWVSDSARYRMLGNAVAVPCAEWIARRLALQAKLDLTGAWADG